MRIFIWFQLFLILIILFRIYHLLDGFKCYYSTVVILLIKYSYKIQTICIQLYSFKKLTIIIIFCKWLNSSIWPIDETPKRYYQSRPKTNGNEVVLLIPQTPGLESQYQMQFFSKIQYIYCTNTLGKGMNPIILPPAMGK